MSAKTETKTESTPATKKRTGRGKKVGKVLIGILCAIVCIAVITAVVNTVGNSANMKKAKSFPAVEYQAQLTPEKDAHGNYTFTTDKTLKVLQLTDVHIGGGWLCFKKDSMAINAVAAMVTAEKPDLVIVTGDIAYPVPFQAGTFNNKPPAKEFASLMETLGVYWTLCFGNHDTELYSYHSREAISKLYESGDYPHCLFTAGPEDVDGYGNQIITVKNSAGKLTQLFYLLDSHTYTGGDFLGIMWKYDNIHQNQIDWYENTLKTYEQENGGPVKSALFFHIPLTEYKDAWYEYIENGQKDTENVKYVFGTAGESKKVVYCGVGDDDLFEKVQELGSTQAIFCGHDHYNNFSVEYKGVRLTYGRSVDYLAYPGIYKQGSQRGCTVIGVNPDGTMDIAEESYYQDKYRSYYDKEEVTMQEVTVVTDLPTE